MKKLVVATLGVVACASASSADITYFGGGTIGYNENSEEFYSVELGVDFGNYAISAGNINAASDLYAGFDGMPYEFYTQKAAPFGSSYQPYLIRGDASFGVTHVALSYEVDGGREGIALGVATSIGNVDVSAAYQQDGIFVGCCGLEGTGAVYGATVGFAFYGIDTTVAYIFGDHSGYSESYESLGVHMAYAAGQYMIEGYVAAENSSNSNPIPHLDSTTYGASVTYDFGKGSVRGYYYGETVEDNDRLGFDVSYDLSNDFVIYAGYEDQQGTYAEVVYGGLGNNIELGLSYSEYYDAKPLAGIALEDGISAFITATF